MFGKLLKYEMRYYSKIMLFIYTGFLILCVLTRAAFALTEYVSEYFGIASALTVFLVIISLFAVLILPFIMAAIRFYKNIVGNEGYLTFTLPVKTVSIVASKLVNSIIWILFSTVVAAGGVMVLLSYKKIFQFFGDAINALFYYPGNQEYINNVLTVVISLAITLFVSSLCNISMLYASMAIGQLASKHKVLVSIACYFGLNYASQIVTGIISYILDVTLFYNATDSNIGYTMLYSTNYALAVLQLILCAVWFFITVRILDKKLNLQ